MGNKIFGVDIAKQVNSALKLTPGTLVKIKKGESDPTDYTAVSKATETEYPFQGSYKFKEFRGDDSQVIGNAEVKLMGDSILAVDPEIGDRVKMHQYEFELVSLMKVSHTRASFVFIAMGK